MSWTRPLEVRLSHAVGGIPADDQFLYARGIHQLTLRWGSDALVGEQRPFPIGASGTLVVDNSDDRWTHDGPFLTTDQRLQPWECSIAFRPSENVVRGAIIDGRGGALQNDSERIWVGWAQLNSQGTTSGPQGRATFSLFDDFVRTREQDYSATYQSAGTSFATAWAEWHSAIDYGVAIRDSNISNPPTWTLGPFSFGGSALGFLQSLAEMVDGYVWFNRWGETGVAEFTWLRDKLPTQADATSVMVPAGDDVLDGVVDAPLLEGIENRLTPKQQIITSRRQEVTRDDRFILNPTLATRKGTAWAYSSLIFSLPEGAGRAEAGTAGAYLSRSRIAYVNTRGVYGLAGIRSVLFPQTITTGVDYLANGTAMRWWMGGDGQTPALQPGPPITWWWSYANPPGQDGSRSPTNPYENAASQSVYGIREAPRPEWYNIDEANLVAMDLQAEIDRIAQPEQRVVYQMPLWQRDETRSKDVAYRMGVGEGVHLLNIPDKSINAKAQTLAARLDYAPRRGPPILTFADIVLQEVIPFEVRAFGQGAALDVNPPTFTYRGAVYDWIRISIGAALGDGARSITTLDFRSRTGNPTSTVFGDDARTGWRFRWGTGDNFLTTGEAPSMSQGQGFSRVPNAGNNPQRDRFRWFTQKTGVTIPTPTADAPLQCWLERI